MKRVVALGVLMLCASLYAEEKAKLVVTPDVSVQLQAQRMLFDNKSKNNLDQLWGRVNMGIGCKADGFAAKAVLRVFPAGFGYDVLTYAKFVDGMIADSVTTKSTNLGKVQIPEAWAAFTSKIMTVKVGCWWDVSNTEAGFFGNYLDDPINGGFKSRGPVINALQFTVPASITSTQITLIANDIYLNKGDLRIFETVKLTDKITFGAGGRSNVFDRIYDSVAVVKGQLDFQGAATLMKDFRVFAEVGILNLSSATTDTLYAPILLGSTVPTMGYLDKVQIELEILDRSKGSAKKASTANLGMGMLSIYAMKKFCGNSRLEVGLYNANVSFKAKAGQFGIGTRWSTAY